MYNANKYYVYLIYTFQITTDDELFSLDVTHIERNIYPDDVLKKYKVPLTLFDNIPSSNNE